MLGNLNKTLFGFTNISTLSLTTSKILDNSSSDLDGITKLNDSTFSLNLISFLLNL
jgi:hypothetical protein